MDVTRERISCIWELREILLSFRTSFNLASAAVVCAILESISGLEPSSVRTEPRYLKLVTVSRSIYFAEGTRGFKNCSLNKIYETVSETRKDRGKQANTHIFSMDPNLNERCTVKRKRSIQSHK